MIAITNASPLIYLGKIGILGILQNLFSEIYTTKEVKDEVLKKKNTSEYTILNQAFDSWLSLKTLQDDKIYKKLVNLNIHAGECSVIALALEMSNAFLTNQKPQLLKEKIKKPIVLLDDFDSREIALSLNLEVTGTLGVIIRATKLGLFSKDESKQNLKKLVQNTNFRIDTRTYTKVIDSIDNL